MIALLCTNEWSRYEPIVGPHGQTCALDVDLLHARIESEPYGAWARIEVFKLRRREFILPAIRLVSCMRAARSVCSAVGLWHRSVRGRAANGQTNHEDAIGETGRRTAHALTLVLRS